MSPEQGPTGQETMQQLDVIADGYASVNNPNKTPSTNSNTQPNTSRSDESRGQGDTLPIFRMTPENEMNAVIEKISTNEKDPDRKLAELVYGLLKSKTDEEFKKAYNAILTLENNKAEQATKKIHEGIQLLVYKIFENVLNTAPDQDFANTVSSLSTYGNAFYQINSTTLFADLTSKINDLTTKFSSVKLADSDLVGIKIQEKILMMPNGQTKSYTTPGGVYSTMTTGEWLKQIREVLELEKSFLEVSYNLSYILRVKQDKPLEVVGAEMRKLKNQSLLSALTGYEEISRGQDTLYETWLNAFQQYNWQTDGDFLSPKRGEDNLPEINAKSSLKVGKEWRNLRGFTFAKVAVYGQEFFPWLLSSRATPNWDGDNPGQLDQGKVSRIFTPWDIIERWFGGDQFIHGAAFLPAKSGVDNPLAIIDKCKDLYLKSKKYGLLGIRNDKDFDGALMWATFSNVFKQFGLDGTGGERLQLQYSGFLRGLFNKETERGLLNDDSNSLRLEYGTHLFRDGFKLVENVGVNIVKNFCEAYVLKEAMFDIDASGNFIHIDKFESMFKYIFSRYFNNNVINGNSGFYTEFSSADDYWNYIKANIFNIKGSAKDVGWESRANELKKHLYDAMTIMHMERNPTIILSSEPPNISQNGVILLNELTRTLSQSTDWGNNDAEKVSNIQNAISNLQKAERLLRADITRKMTQANNVGAVYGSDLEQNGYEFVLNENNIRTFLTDIGINETEISQALQIFQFIRQNLWAKPIADAVVHKDMIDSYGGEREYRELESRNVTERLRYFSKIWNEGLLGFELTIGTANNFLEKDVLGAGAINDVIGSIDTITLEFKRFIEGTGEGESIYELINTFVRKGGEENLENICNRLNSLYGKMKSESPDMAKEALRISINIIIQALKAPKDKSFLNIPALSNIFPPDSLSLAGSAKVAGLGEEHTFSEQEIYDLISFFVDKATLPMGIKYSKSKLVSKTSDEIARDTALGDPSTEKWVTEASSINAQDILERYGATINEIVKGFAGPAVILLLIAFLWTVLKGGWDESQK